MDYQETSGVLSWADGEAGTRTIEIGLVRRAATSSFPNFRLLLQTVEGAPIMPCAAVSIAISHQGPPSGGNGGTGGSGNGGTGANGNLNDSAPQQSATDGGGAIDGLALALLLTLLLWRSSRTADRHAPSSGHWQFLGEVVAVLGPSFMRRRRARGSLLTPT
jgi:hypothetical protein